MLSAIDGKQRFSDKLSIYALNLILLLNLCANLQAALLILLRGLSKLYNKQSRVFLCRTLKKHLISSSLFLTWQYASFDKFRDSPVLKKLFSPHKKRGKKETLFLYSPFNESDGYGKSIDGGILTQRKSVSMTYITPNEERYSTATIEAHNA
jgi:hypothetical protein